MLFREHRGTLEASLRTEVSLQGTLDAIIEHFNKSLLPFQTKISKETLHAEFYCKDIRKEAANYEKTFIIISADYGVIGFTNKMPE